MIKICTSILLIAVLLSSNGCMSYNAVQLAKGKPYLDSSFVYVSPADDKCHPGYYALLPLTVPLDIVTSPFQGIWYGFMYVVVSGVGSTP